MGKSTKRTFPEPFIVVILPVLSLCLTFVLLYIFMPRLSHPASVVSEVSPNIVHEAVSSAAFLPPTQLKIGNINLSANVVPVGLTSQGDMDIDDNPDQVAWYKLGPKPGEEGSAVIAGHYGWKDGVGSVFNYLHTLKKGDEITTVSEDGRTLRFVVNRSAMYAPNQDATDVFKSDDGKAHLNLITCQGTWSQAEATYSQRLVVFTDLVQ